MRHLQRLPEPVEQASRRAVRLLRRNRSVRALALRACLRRVNGPFSEVYGFDRGTPVDRPYIEQFLGRHAADVRGRVLEVKGDEYARRFGSHRVSHVDIVDVDADNPRATIVADLDAPDALRPSDYDCILLTQTLQFLTPDRALASLYAALRPGGVLLLTVSALCRMETPESDRWRLPPVGLQEVLRATLPPDAELEVEGRGNAVAVAALALGLVVEELRPAQLEAEDWRFPVVTLARVRRPVAGA